MGSFYVSVAIESLAHRSERRTLDSVLVDTGSELTWIPAELLEQLGVEREGVQRFIIAEEGDITLLGARSLEGMNLRVDPRAKRLVPAGPIVTASLEREVEAMIEVDSCGEGAC